MFALRLTDVLKTIPADDTISNWKDFLLVLEKSKHELNVTELSFYNDVVSKYNLVIQSHLDALSNGYKQRWLTKKSIFI